VIFRINISTVRPKNELISLAEKYYCINKIRTPWQTKYLALTDKTKSEVSKASYIIDEVGEARKGKDRK